MTHDDASISAVLRLTFASTMNEQNATVSIWSMSSPLHQNRPTPQVEPIPQRGKGVRARVLAKVYGQAHERGIASDVRGPAYTTWAGRFESGLRRGRARARRQDGGGAWSCTFRRIALAPYLLFRDWVTVSFSREHWMKAGKGKDSLSISPLSMSSLTSFGLRPSTWHPTLKAVPRISFTVPLSSFANDLNLMVRAISITSSRVMDLVCLMFFSFLRSRGGSFRALMTREEAEGTTETTACRF